MYQVLIVDDEAEIRNGLSLYFPWNSLSFEVAGTAGNGVEALDFIERNHVDVLVSDIKMPEITGLELARELFNRKSKIKTVLLSSYREFEYAQSAIEYHVRYYLLKPTKFDKLSEVFTQIYSELDREHGAGSTKRNYGERPSENAEYYQNIIQSIKNYITENYKTATLKSTATHIGMNPYYLSSFFKQHTNEMFSEYLTRTKMQRAAEMLLSPSIKIYEICDELGYSTANNFSRSFKAYYQMSPSEYRQAHQVFPMEDR